MKTHHILGALWLAYCSIFGGFILWQFGSFLFAPHPRITPGLFMAILICLLYLAGAVASIFLIRGARWARIFIGLIAVLSVIACIGQIVSFRSLSFWGGISGAFALVSVVLLFWPKHEPVA